MPPPASRRRKASLRPVYPLFFEPRVYIRTCRKKKSTSNNVDIPPPKLLNFLLLRRQQVKLQLHAQLFQTHRQGWRGTDMSWSRGIPSPRLPAANGTVAAVSAAGASIFPTVPDLLRNRFQQTQTQLAWRSRGRAGCGSLRPPAASVRVSRRNSRPLRQVQVLSRPCWPLQNMLPAPFLLLLRALLALRNVAVAGLYIYIYLSSRRLDFPLTFPWD